MITLDGKYICFHYPHLHPTAQVCFSFQRTLRLPDTEKVHSLPPGLGAFPVVSASDYRSSDTAEALRDADFAMPMYQSEAMWISFHATLRIDNAPRFRFPAAVIVEAGGVNAVSAGMGGRRLEREPQNYMVLPEQPWLDGFASAPGVVRQFVATALGRGATIEEQLTGTARNGGMQFHVIPIKEELFRQRLKQAQEDYRKQLQQIAARRSRSGFEEDASMRFYAIGGAMGLGAGGRMRQKIYPDSLGIDAWDASRTLSMRLAILDSVTWRDVTGQEPPHRSPTAAQYTAAGLPWFELYDADKPALAGAVRLAAAKSVGQVLAEQGEPLIAADAPVQGEVVSAIGALNPKSN